MELDSNTIKSDEKNTAPEIPKKRKYTKRKDKIELDKKEELREPKQKRKYVKKEVIEEDILPVNIVAEVPLQKRKYTRKNATKEIEDKPSEIIVKTKKSIVNLIAKIWSTIVGGIAPVISYDVAHHQATPLSHKYNNGSLLWIITLGLLIYSAPTVQDYLDRFVNNKLKSWGFVIAMEVSMTFTEGWTSLASLAMIVSINALVLGRTMGNNPIGIENAETE